MGGDNMPGRKEHYAQNRANNQDDSAVEFWSAKKCWNLARKYALERQPIAYSLPMTTPPTPASAHQHNSDLSTRRSHLLVKALIMLCIASSQAVAQNEAALEVVNGDFSDLSGMTGPDPHGWYRGMPAGWQAQSRNVEDEGNYAVNAYDGATKPVCNVCQLGFLKQQVGVVNEMSDVVLEFDVSEPWGKGSVMGVGILGNGEQPLAVKELEPGPGQQLVAHNVPAGTTITVQFWAVSSTPALDNVAVSLRAPTTEP